MNRLFIAMDGDNAGQHIGQAVLMDDVQMLHDVSNKIKAGADAVAQMIQSSGGQIISSGGDELTAILDPSNEQKIEEMRAKFQEVAGFSVTVGMGNTLSQAGKALIAGKLTGKDKVMRYDDSVEQILMEAHQATMEGTADEEQRKMDEHYISDTMDQDGGDQMADDQQGFPEDDAMYEEDYQSEDNDFNPEEASFDDQAPDQEFSEDDMGEEMPMDEMSEEQPMDDEAHQMMDFPENGDQEYSDEAEPSQFDDTADETQNLDQENPEFSDFEQEQPIELDGEEVVDQASQDPEAEKADAVDVPPEMAEEDLQSEMSDQQGNEDLMQRIAANLDSFKQNKELLEQIKDQNPELYDSMLALLQDLIDLARMITGDEGQPQEEPAAPEEEQAPVAVPSPQDGMENADPKL